MKVSIGTFFYTIYARIILGVILLTLAIPLLLCLLFGKHFLVDNKAFKIIARIFYWCCVKLSFLPITYKGLSNFPDQPCIVVANHQSGFDIPLVGYTLKKRPHIWLAWSELTKSLLLRFILPRIAVLVDQSSPMHGARTLVQSIKIVKEHPWDLIIFPEGGRYVDGNMRDFFSGFAAIAKRIGRPVVPIKIIGINTVYPPDTFWIYYNPVTIIIGQPMTIGPDESEESFKNRVYDWYTQKD